MGAFSTALKHKPETTLARQAGITSGYLSLLMSGKRCPSSDVRRRLMDALSVTRFEDLFIIVRADE